MRVTPAHCELVHINAIVTIIPTNLVANALFVAFLSFRRNQKQELKFLEVDSLVTKIFSFFCLNESRSTSKACQIL